MNNITIKSITVAVALLAVFAFLTHAPVVSRSEPARPAQENAPVSTVSSVPPVQAMPQTAAPGAESARPAGAVPLSTAPTDLVTDTAAVQTAQPPAEISRPAAETSKPQAPGRVDTPVPSIAKSPAADAISSALRERNKFLRTLATDEVKVGTYVLNIRKLDVASGTWVVDFYVWFIWHGEKLIPENFELMNGSVDFKDKPTSDTIEVEGRQYKWLAYRINSTMTNGLNFKQYPLDYQYLTIELEDREQSLEKLKYRVVPEENNIDDHVHVQGWEIKSKFNVVTTHRYNTSFGYEDDTDANLTYSRYVFGITLSRPRFSSLLKLILPLTIILSLSFLSFALTPDKISQRISLSVSTVFTSVAFHINLTSAIPQVSYLTLADRLMISTYFILFVSLISTICLIRYVDANDMTGAARLNRILGTVVPLLGVALILAQFLA